MGFGLLFLPLLGGYQFLTLCNWTRFDVHRQSGYHLLFRSASVGLLLLVFARVLALLLNDVVQSWPYVVEDWQRFAPFPYVGTVALAYLLGRHGYRVINVFYSESRGAIRAADRAGNSLELLFIEAMNADSTVELTLQSGKAYVGWILNVKVEEVERKFVEMLPLASGFRTQETNKLEFTTNYAPVLLDHPDPAKPLLDHSDPAKPLLADLVTTYDLRVVIPVTEVRSARPFDLETYLKFQEDDLVD